MVRMFLLSSINVIIFSVFYFFFIAFLHICNTLLQFSSTGWLVNRIIAQGTWLIRFGFQIYISQGNVFNRSEKFGQILPLSHVWSVWNINLLGTWSASAVIPSKLRNGVLKLSTLNFVPHLRVNCESSCRRSKYIKLIYNIYKTNDGDL